MKFDSLRGFGGAEILINRGIGETFEGNFVHRLVEIITAATHSEIIASFNYAFIKEIRLLH